MHRRSLLLAALVALVTTPACGPDSDSDRSGETGTRQPQENRTSGTEASEASRSTADVTGAPVFQRDVETIRRDVAALEKRERPTDADKLADYEREVRRMVAYIDITLQALRVSIQAESRGIVQKSYVLLMGTHQRLHKDVDRIWREIVEIRDVLAADKRGTAAIPPGFTKDELNDRKGDLEEQLLKKREALAELAVEVDKKIKLLEKAKVPEQATTTLTKERDVLIALRERAAKLLPKG
ncbi:MAG: hypothetical protein ACYTGZ_16815 [Planctomycetota bacterium]|jgi:hypothetical protein